MSAALKLRSARELVAPELAEVERRLAQALRGSEARAPGEHLLLGGGKRLRPLVTLLATRAAGIDPEQAITIALAAELLHAATLLHDDVVDEGGMRRGRPAARIVFGNAAAVLAGDALLARALLSAVGCGTQAMAALAETVAELAEGELLQLRARHRWDAPPAVALTIVERKTGALLRFCAEVGSLAPAPMRPALRRFRLRLGVAFQLTDDVLDCCGDPGVMGKPRGQDLREGNPTFPLLLACRAYPDLLRLPLSEALALVHRSGAFRTAAAEARGAAREAACALMALPPSPAREALEELAAGITERLS